MKRIYLFLIFSIFILLVFPSFTTNVMGMTAYYNYGFDYTTATQQVSSSDYGNGFFYSYDVGGYGSAVDTTRANGGSKSYRVLGGAGNGIATFNSTLGENFYLINMSFDINYQSGGTPADNKICYFQLRDFNDTLLMYWWFRAWTVNTKLDFGYTDHNGVDQEIEDEFASDVWHHVWISYQANDSVTIGVRSNLGVTTEVSGVQPRNVVDRPIVNYTDFRVSIAMAVGDEYWIDNFACVFTNDWEGFQYGYFDLSDYNEVCNGGSSFIQIAEKRYVEDEYPVKLTTSIVAVELFISNDQYNQVSSSLSDYYAYCNGFPLNNPDEIEQYSTTSYKLRWLNLNIGIEDTKPVFEFYCSAYNTVGGTKYYWFGLGVNTGGGLYKYHNSATAYGNGNYDGTSSNFGLNMCFYFAGVEQPAPDYADIDNIYPVVDTGGVYYEWNTIMFGYTITLPSPNTYIRLYKDGVKVTEQGYESKVAVPYAGGCSFGADSDSDGNYMIELNRSGVSLDSYNFTVYNLSNEWEYNAQIMTYPVPSGDGKSFTIEWLYNKTYYDNKNAYILRSDYDYLEIGGYVTIKGYIQNSGTTPDTITLQKDRQYPKTQWFYMLCILQNGSFVPIAKCPHWVGEFYTNQLYSEKNSYVITSHSGFNYDFADVHLYGGHSFIGADVYVLINDGSVLKHYVGGNNAIDISVPITGEGFYKAELVRYTSNDTYHVYATANFTVTDEYGVIPEQTWAEIIDEIFNDDQQWILAICIIVFFVVLPIYMNYTWQNNLLKRNIQVSEAVKIPSFIYLVMFVCGLATDIWLELLDVYTIALFVFVTIMATVWLLAKGGYLDRFGG